MLTPTSQSYTDLFRAALKDGALHIDASQLEGRFMHCPREWAYYALAKREAVRDFAGRDFGKFVHEYIMKPHYSGKNPNEVNAIMVDAWAANLPIKDENDYRTLAYAEQLYATYLETYPSESFDVVQCEVPFALPLCELPVIWPENRGLPSEIGVYDKITPVPVLLTGRIDLLVRMHFNDRLRIMDHKTSSVGGSTYFSGWTNSSQLHGYVWAAEQLVDEAVEAYDVNALFLRKPTKTGKAIELQRQTYLVGDNPETHREALAAWHTNTLNAIASIGDCLAREYFPRHTCNCKRVYGICEYHETCRFSPGRDALLNTNMYQPVTWSPLD